jgi:hypothetical protein
MFGRETDARRVRRLTSFPTDWDYIAVFLVNIEVSETIIKAINFLEDALGFNKSELIIASYEGDSYNEVLLPARLWNNNPHLKELKERAIFKVDYRWTTNPVILSLLATTIRSSIGERIDSYQDVLKVIGEGIQEDYHAPYASEILDIYIRNWRKLHLANPILTSPAILRNLKGFQGDYGVCYLTSNVHPDFLEQYEKVYGVRHIFASIIRHLTELAMKHIEGFADAGKNKKI